ncbi:hypothetical protein [Pseudoduganella lutea]|uniref:Uncharacterized protein n=1 Tax=Pseudoduganella lutea TaxID=321985 RepID=A0A4P6L5F7_9BURK|nr:hypothetical protein [Pseudoduganella lutea]QBE66860.1 hypothetical protein EWM63_31030 [Pseudoduganella lutea]
MKIPMREKYVDEATGGHWIIFGTRGDGTVDVSDANRDIFEGLPKEAAEKVIEARSKFMAELYGILSAFP